MENDHTVAATKCPHPPRRHYNFRSNVPTMQLLAVLHLFCLLPLVSFSLVCCRQPHKFSVNGSRVLLRNSNCEVQLIVEPTQRAMAVAMLDYGNFDMLWRGKIEEQADLQQALELQSRRLVGLQLLDVQKHILTGLFLLAVQFLPPLTLPLFSIKLFSFLCFTIIVQNLY
ncbi:hypothetical protein WN944_029477 [Citrus x changshan-huyou]|uniref:Uncharacterized protein n=1 Tax=Citrus x changshan-huyou TaxID=2935761 RepID=A0AAP0QAD1_9ROSI